MLLGSHRLLSQGRWVQVRWSSYLSDLCGVEMLPYNLKAIYRYRQTDRQGHIPDGNNWRYINFVRPLPSISVLCFQFSMMPSKSSLFRAARDKIYNNTSEWGHCKLITLMAMSARQWDNIQSLAKHYFPPHVQALWSTLGLHSHRHAYDLDNCFKLFLLLFMCRVTIESPWRWKAISCGQRIILEGAGWFWSAETPF